MATVTALPPTLRDKLASLARRIRGLRVVRGVSLVLLTLAVVGGASLLLDSALGLPPVARAALLAVWLTLGLVAAVFGLILPVCRPLDPEALAALIEEKYPDLGERLTSAVELAEHPGAYHGSPALVELLLQETEVRAGRLDFLQTFPARSSGWLAALTAVALLLLVTPAAVAPVRCKELAERFLFPWHIPQVLVPYTLDVTPGDTVAANGRPLTFAVQVRPRNEGIVLPPACTLVQVDAAGRTSRVPMLADRPDAFSLRLDRVAGDFEYHVEAGRVVSDAYHVTAVDPIDLAADSPTITVTPPEYAKTALDAETVHGVVDLEALQYSRVLFDLRFTGPAVAARLEWSSQTGQSKEEKVHELPLSPDRRGARLELPALADGSYRLVLEGEHGIRTEVGPRLLTVKVDHPPAFLKPAPGETRKPEWKLEADATGRQFRPVQDSAQGQKTVLPYDSVPLDLALADDLAVARAEVEYRINDGPSQFENIALQGQGTRQATARHVFKLAEKALKEGDTVRYRLKAVDNRQVPEANLGPNVVYYPSESRWLTLKIARQAEPLRQQEIVAQRDEINRRLEAIKNNLQHEQRGVYKVRQETRNQPALDREPAQQLKELRKENRATENALRELARDAAETPALQPLGDLARDVSDREMHHTDEALRASEKETQADPRDRDLQKAEQEVAAALQRLDELRRANDRLAQARLDQMKLEMLAQRQQSLADRAADQAERDPIKQPDSRPQQEQLKREQGEVANEAQRLAEQSEPLRSALDANRAEQARQLADRARDLARSERELAEASRQTQQHQDQGRLAALARKQQELAEQAGRLARETRPATQTARTGELKPEEARKAAESLRQGNAAEAVNHQEHSARELDRVAKELERAADLARDPREAARQLARLQDDLRQRLKDDVKKSDPKAALAHQLEGIQHEQEAIRQAVKALDLPEHDANVQKDRKEADDRAGQATKALYKPDAAEADARMKEASQALERLANRVPSLEERQRRAREEVARLRRHQDETARQAEQAVQQAAKDNPNDATKAHDQLAQRLTDAVRRQAEDAERLGKLDAPEQNASRQKAEEALDRALADLMDARPQDIAASQQEARRQLEQLEQALTGRKPAQEQRVSRYENGQPKPNEPRQPAPRQAAQELARQQRQLAQATEQARKQSGEQGKQALAKVAEQQRQLNEQARKLPTQQAPKAVAEARTAMNQAEQTLHQNDAGQAQQRQNDAANALDRLAQQLPERVAPAPVPQPEQPAAPPQGLPARPQAEQARQLAQQQRELRDAVQNLVKQSVPPQAPRDHPVTELAQKQQQIAQEAAELAHEVAREQGRQAPPTQQAQQAAQGAQQAARQMQAGALPPARQAGEQTARQLRQLAQQLSQTPRGDPDPNAPETMPQARQLAQRQEDLNRQLEPLAQDAAAQRAQQQARQQQLQRQSGDLAKQLAGLAKEMNRPPQAQQSTQKAAASAEQGQTAMQRAQEQQQQGNQGRRQQSQEQAAHALDQAGRLLDEAAQQVQTARQNPSQNPQAEQRTGQALEQARQQMNQAQADLNQNQNQAAQSAMQRAAQALQQAGQQLGQQQQAQPGQPSPQSQPNAVGAAGGGQPNDNPLDAEAKKYAGKRWGELPGELRTRILQDMKARYGDDYARIIKLYFEQIAETPKK